MADRLQPMLSTPEVLKARNCSNPTLYDDITAGRFPRPMTLGPMGNAWPESHFVAARQGRIADRDAATAKFREGA